MNDILPNFRQVVVGSATLEQMESATLAMVRAAFELIAHNKTIEVKSKVDATELVQWHE